MEFVEFPINPQPRTAIAILKWNFEAQLKRCNTIGPPEAFIVIINLNDRKYPAFLFFCPPPLPSFF